MKSTLKIPPRHNGIIPITIKGHNLKTPVRYFSSNQHVNMELDPNIHVINRICNIKVRSTLHILVANYTNKHVTFNKGQCIGHTEPSTDHMPQTSINSLTTKKMIGWTCSNWYFLTSLTYPPWWCRENHSFNCFRYLNCNFHRMG